MPCQNKTFDQTEAKEMLNFPFRERIPRTVNFIPAGDCPASAFPTGQRDFILFSKLLSLRPSSEILDLVFPEGQVYS